MDAVTTITLPIEPRIVWGTLAVLGLAALCGLFAWIQPRVGNKTAPLERAVDAFGMQGFPPALFLIFAILWMGLMVVLTVGLFIIIGDVMISALPSREASGDLWEFRFKLVQLTALTTVLGATVALPLTMTRLRLQRQTNATSEEVLFNQKITDAAADLYARRQRSVEDNDGKYHDVWEDDIARRNAAIDRLEGLVRERPDVVERVSRLLSVYVQELSAENEVPRGLGARSDMENAVQTLGRLRDFEGVIAEQVKINLSSANLQRMQFQGGNFESALLNKAQMQGAYLLKTKLQGASLIGAQLQGANLIWAKLQGANLGWAKFDNATDLSTATLRGAALRSVDDTSIAQLRPFWQDVFADGSVQVPEEERPDHWSDEELDFEEFRDAWRAWQRSIGQDPKNPE